MHSPLARAIREARVSVGLTQVELGVHMGLKGRAVSRWERGDSVPRKRFRSSLVRAIQARSAETAAVLAAAFESHAARTKGIVEPPPAPAPSPPARPTVPLALELAIFAMADELDLAPQRLRAALMNLLPRIADAGYSLEAAHREVEQRVRTREVPAAVHRQTAPQVR
jgi:transcriptional regulator with XRE-family HTH domain